MTAKVIDGKLFAANVRAQVQVQVAKLREEHGIQPGLAVVLGGRRPGKPSLCAQQTCLDPRGRHGLV